MLIEFFTHLADVRVANWLERFYYGGLVHAIKISFSKAAKKNFCLECGHSKESMITSLSQISKISENISFLFAWILKI